MYDKILIPTDGSDQAAQAVEHGLDFAEAFGATVHALYVVETEATYILTVGLGDDEMEEYKQFGEETVADVVEAARARGLEATGAVKTGRVSEEIVEYAQKNEIDHIVMGKQGRGAIAKYIGGTAEKVMRMSGIPVTAIGPGSK